MQTLVNPSAAEGDQFGFAATLSGDTVAIGAPYNDDPNSNHGKVFVFNAMTGSLTHSLLPNTRVSESNFGYSLDLDGTTLAVGAPFSTLGNQAAGIVWLFNTSTGLQSGNGVQNSTRAINENFGTSVAVSGSKLLVGVPGESTGGARRGMVQFFDIPTRTFFPNIANPTPANDDRFGDALAIDGGRLAVGATGDSAVNHREGAAYLYNASTLSASLSTGVLTITDIGTSSTLTAVRDGNDLLIQGGSDTFDAAPVGTLLENYGRTLRVPFASLSELRFTLGIGVDSLTVDVSNGDVIPAAGLVFDGGATGDGLTIVGGGQGAVTYTAATANSGSIALENFGTITP